MRLAAPALVFALVLAPGCGDKPDMRADPVEVKGTVALPGGASPKDLVITFQPQQNSQPGGGKVGADGSFTVSLVPGNYVVYFQEEANAGVPAYKNVPDKYRTANEENVVSVGSGSLSIQVK